MYGNGGRSAGMLAVTLLAGLVLTGCDAKTATRKAAGDKPLVVTTTTVITDLARQIGGDRVRVVGLMKPGVDPHTYEPRPDDSILVRKADVVLYNGLHLEGKMVDVFENAGGKAVALAEDERIKTRGSATYKGAPDPHCWWNPQYFAVYAERARDALMETDSAHADYYRQRAADFLAALKTLDGQIRAAIERIPPAQRYLITSHDAFYYYGDAYGLKVDAVLGISTDAGVGALRIDELAALVTKHKIPAIFHETSVSASLNEMVDRVVELSAKRGHKVTVPHTALYSDSLGEPDTPAGTYLGALRENTRVIVSALAGQDVSDILAPKEVAGDGE